MEELVKKLDAWGVQRLEQDELLALLLGDRELAKAVLAQYDGVLVRIGEEDVARLRMVCGMGIGRARQLAAAMEFGRRVAAAKAMEGEVIHSSEDVVREFRLRIDRCKHEECWVVHLTSANRILERQCISQGGVQGTVVDYRLIVKRALELLSTQLILIHNHPSGAAEPSPQDKVLTNKVARAAALFDIRLLDHLIISREGDFSFRRAELL